MAGGEDGGSVAGGGCLALSVRLGLWIARSLVLARMGDLLDGASGCGIAYGQSKAPGYFIVG